MADGWVSYVVTPDMYRAGLESIAQAAESAGRVLERFDTGHLLFGGGGDGLFEVKVGDKWGYIDSSGKLVINPQFDEARGFSEGLARINQGGKWGYIDTSGKIACEFNY